MWVTWLALLASVQVMLKQPPGAQLMAPWGCTCFCAQPSKGFLSMSSLALKVLAHRALLLPMGAGTSVFGVTCSIMQKTLHTFWVSLKSMRSSSFWVKGMLEQSLAAGHSAIQYLGILGVVATVRSQASLFFTCLSLQCPASTLARVFKVSCPNAQHWHKTLEPSHET